MLKAFNKVKVAELKQQIILNTTLAQQIYERIGNLLSDKESREFTPVWDMFPGLFDEEKKVSEEHKKNLELERYKAQFINYALKHNLGRGE
ncbi:MAG: hypothetical protein RR791_05200 [Lachnospiraceae bacterium]